MLKTHKKGLKINYAHFCAAFLSALLIAFTAPAKAQENALAKLTGFEAGAPVTYEVKDHGHPQRILISGADKISENGALNVVWPDGSSADLSENQDGLIYIFTIQESAGDIQVEFKNDDNGVLKTISGKTPHEFSDIVVKGNGQSLTTKTDWAGLFAGTGLSADPKIPDDHTYKVAFLSGNTMRTLNDVSSPAQIEIYYSAPFGGGPSDVGVNVYSTTTYCGERHVDLSYCNQGRVNTQNRNLVENIVWPLQAMTEQLVNIMMSSTGHIGRYFDAKEMMETLRDQQVLKAQAVKEYHPSQQMCRIGSFSKSLASAHYKADEDRAALNKILTDTTQNKSGSASRAGNVSYYTARLKQYREVYCDPMDNDAGLFLLCEHDQNEDFAGPIGAAEPVRVNKDIDFTRTLDFPLTLNVNFSQEDVTADEEDIVALARNLFWPDAIRTLPEDTISKDPVGYASARQLTALKSLAHNSFTHMTAMKSQSADPQNGNIPGWAHMKTLLRDFGMNDEDIARILGQNPSYYAQMDVLTKKLYQNPDFYTDLYDKPANVDRIMAAMDAIALMQQRDHYEAALRSEMLTSGMIAEALHPKIQNMRARIEDLRP